MSILDTANNIFKAVIGGGNYPTIWVTSTVDGKQYKVRNMPDRQEAANLMARLRLRLIKLTDTLEQKYPDKPQDKHLASPPPLATYPPPLAGLLVASGFRRVGRGVPCRSAAKS